MGRYQPTQQNDLGIFRRPCFINLKRISDEKSFGTIYQIYLRVQHFFSSVSEVSPYFTAGVCIGTFLFEFLVIQLDAVQLMLKK